MKKQTHFLGVRMKDDEYVPDYSTMFRAAFTWAFILWVIGLTIFGIVRLIVWL